MKELNLYKRSKLRDNKDNSYKEHPYKDKFK